MSYKFVNNIAVFHKNHFSSRIAFPRYRTLSNMKAHRTFGIERINGRTICLNILKVSLTRAIIGGIATVISARLFTGCSPNPPALNVFAVVAIPRGIKVTIFFPTSCATPIGPSSFKYSFHLSPTSPVKSVRCAVSSSRCARSKRLGCKARSNAPARRSAIAVNCFSRSLSYYSRCRAYFGSSRSISHRCSSQSRCSSSAPSRGIKMCCI